MTSAGTDRRAVPRQRVSRVPSPVVELGIDTRRGDRRQRVRSGLIAARRRVRRRRTRPAGSADARLRCPRRARPSPSSPALAWRAVVPRPHGSRSRSSAGLLPRAEARRSRARGSAAATSTAAVAGSSRPCRGVGGGARTAALAGIYLFQRGSKMPRLVPTAKAMRGGSLSGRQHISVGGNRRGNTRRTFNTVAR
jgi:hypothetical protein